MKSALSMAFSSRGHVVSTFELLISTKESEVDSDIRKYLVMVVKV